MYRLVLLSLCAAFAASPAAAQSPLPVDDAATTAAAQSPMPVDDAATTPPVARPAERRPGAWRSIALSESRAVAGEPRRVASLDALAERVARLAAEEFGGTTIAANETWMTIIDCRDPRDPRIGSYQGSERVYPASVIKLCYMLAAFDQMATGRLELDADLQLDLEEMIFESDNKATNRILDRLTNTGFGPSLEGDALASFAHKRLLVARYMESIGLEGLFAANKTYDEEVPLYGRDVDFLGPKAGDNFTNSNMMTTDATARLLYLLWNHAVVSPQACDTMLELIHRGPEKTETTFCKIKPAGAEIYSKSGYTGLCRHDAAIFALPEGGAVIVVVFSKERGEDAEKKAQTQVIARAAELALAELLAQPGSLDGPTQEIHNEREGNRP